MCPNTRPPCGQYKHFQFRNPHLLYENALLGDVGSACLEYSRPSVDTWPGAVDYVAHNHVAVETGVRATW